MSGIFSFLISFCVGSITIGAMYFLLPDGAMKKPVKYILCVCFLCLVVSFLPKYLNIDFSGFNSTVADYSDESGIKAAELTIKSALKMAGIEYTSIYITPQKNSAGSIDFLYVEIHTKSNLEAVKNALSSENIKVSVINE